MAEHSIFGGSAPPGTFTRYTDGGGALRVANMFYKFTGTDAWTCVGARLWVPTGTAAAWNADGVVTAYCWVMPYGSTLPTWATPTASATFGTLVDGWNVARWSTPVSFNRVNHATVPQWIYVGYKSATGNMYLHTPDPSGSGAAYQASDASALYLSELSPYGRSANSLSGSTGSALYGTDIVVDDGASAGTTGALSAIVPKITAAVAGASLTNGTFAAAVPKVTASISGGNVAVTGTLSASTPKVTASLPGTIIAPVTGALVAAAPKVTASVPGAVIVTGTMSATTPKVTASLSNVVALTIAQENALTSGVQDRTFWYDYGTDTIPGFPRSTYYTPGQTAQFSVDYNSAFTADVFRLGWYGGSTNARKVASAISGTPTAQPAAATIPSSNGAVTCAAWSNNLSWSIPADATPGWYWVLMKNAGGTVFGGMLFCVSDVNAKKSVVVVSSDATWHAAYSGYGGNNVYGASTGIGSIDARALCSTYDKPVLTRDNVPQTHFFNGELAQLRFMERCGLEVGYTTCEQINNDPTILDGRTLVIFSGHNEYISTRIRNKVETIVAAGTNVANFAANDFFWRVAYGGTTFPTGATDTSTGRVMWCKKDTMAGPTAIRSGGAGTAFTNSADWTGTWQDTRWAGRKPSRNLLGDDFIANGIRADEVKAPFAMKALPIWRNCAGVQALTTGQTFSFGVGTAGMEWDYPDPTGTLTSVPLSASTVTLTSSASDANGENYSGTATVAHAFQMVRNGTAHIFNANTTQWGWALDDLHLRNTGNVATAEARQASLNVLYDLGATGNTSMIAAASLTVPTPVSDIDVAYGLAATATGTMNTALPKVTASVPGAVITVATLNAATPKTTASISGASVTIGALATQLPVVAASIPGVIIEPVTGTLAASVPKVTATITGESLLPITGTLAANLPRVTTSLPGASTTTGTITATLPKIRTHIDDGIIRNITIGGVTAPADRWPTTIPADQWSAP